jgi:hypothetical protein
MTRSISTYLRRPLAKRGTTLVAAAVAVVALAGAPAFSQSTAALPTGKRPVRIGLAPPKVDLGAGSSREAANAVVAEAIGSMLEGPGIEIVPLAARLEALIRAEAAERQVDFVLFTSVVRKPGKSGNLFTRAEGADGPAAVPIPGGGAVAGHIKTSAVAAAAALTKTVSGATQATDEFRLDYRLADPDAASPRMAKLLTRRAARSGQDVLTPLLEEMGHAILGAIR